MTARAAHFRRVGVLVGAWGVAVACGRSDAPAGPDAGACAADAGPPDLACVLRVEGLVTDLVGAPVPHAAVSMCSHVCYGAAGGEDGRFSIPIGAALRASDYALHVSGRPGFADVYGKVPAPVGGVIAFGAPIRLPPLPASGPPLPASPAAASPLTSGDLTFDIPAGTTFELDVADVALGPLGRELRAASVPLAFAPDFVRTLTGVVALYALAPPGATASTPLAVHIPNASGLPASTPIELYVLDDDYAPIPPTAGTARLVATGRVSADGRTIDSAQNTGISQLTWLAIRAIQ